MGGTTRRGRWLAPLALLALAGCSVEVRAGLTESEADAIVLALDEASIASDKEPERGADRYRVTVPRGELVAALEVLADADLPRERGPDLEALFDRGGLFESPDAERARYALALGNELARSLETIDGVSRARVHLALASAAGAPIDEPAPASRASVLLHARPDAHIEEASVRALVVGAVSGLEAASVEVVRVEARDAPRRPPALAPVGPFAVREADALGVKAVLAGSFAINLLLALVIVALVRDRRRAAPARTPTPET